MFKRVMEYVGLEPERLQIHWISASEGGRVAEVARKMTTEIRALGPNTMMRDAK